MNLFINMCSLIIPGLFFVFGLRLLRSAGQRQDLDVLEDLKNSVPIAARRIVSLKAEEQRSSFLSPAPLLTMLILVSATITALDEEIPPRTGPR